MQSPIHHLSDSGPRIPGNKGPEQILSAEKALLQLPREPAPGITLSLRKSSFPDEKDDYSNEVKLHLPLNSAPPRADNRCRALRGIRCFY